MLISARAFCFVIFQQTNVVSAVATLLIFLYFINNDIAIDGAPGALIAQQLFKHKRSKSAFMSVYWITVVVNLIVLGLIVFEVVDVQAIMIEI